MADQNYQGVFDVPYLSGCCMLARSDAFQAVGGLMTFLSLCEDADLTRAWLGRADVCTCPCGVLCMDEAGNYRNLR